MFELNILVKNQPALTNVRMHVLRINNYLSSLFR